MRIYMGSTMSMSGEKKVLLAHICAGCGNPVLVIGHIHAVKNSYYFLDQAYAEKSTEYKLNKTIEKEMQELAEAVQTCRSTHKSLRALKFLSGIDEPCPCCGAVEAWRTVSPKSEEFDRLREENFPRFFWNGEDWERWMEALLDQTVRENKEYWREHEEQGEMLWNANTRCCNNIEFLKKINEIMPERKETEAMAEQLKSLEEMKQKAKLGQKGDWGKQIKSLKQMMETKKLALQRLEQELQWMIAGQKHDLSDIGYRLHGFSGKWNPYESGDITCFQII